MQFFPGAHSPCGVSWGLITVAFIRSKMLMIDLVCSQIDAKMVALGKHSLIGQSKHTHLPEVLYMLT